jgi:hypothetical protein
MRSPPNRKKVTVNSTLAIGQSLESLNLRAKGYRGRIGPCGEPLSISPKWSSTVPRVADFIVGGDK